MIITFIATVNITTCSDNTYLADSSWVRQWRHESGSAENGWCWLLQCNTCVRPTNRHRRRTETVFH